MKKRRGIFRCYTNTVCMKLLRNVLKVKIKYEKLRKVRAPYDIKSSNLSFIDGYTFGYYCVIDKLKDYTEAFFIPESATILGKFDTDKILFPWKKQEQKFYLNFLKQLKSYDKR